MLTLYRCPSCAFSQTVSAPEGGLSGRLAAASAVQRNVQLHVSLSLGLTLLRGAAGKEQSWGLRDPVCVRDSVEESLCGLPLPRVHHSAAPALWAGCARKPL